MKLDGFRIDPHFGSAEPAGNIALELRGYSKVFGDHTLSGRALEEFDGAILAISHDRYFLDPIVDLRRPSRQLSDFWHRKGSAK